MTIKNFFDAVSLQLKNAGIESHLAETTIIFSETLNISKTQLLLSFSQPISETHQQTIQNIVAKRTQRIPLQHILKKTFFYEWYFKVSPQVLIPRPETEILCQEVVQYISSQCLSVLDLCTGSGCIAITVAKKCPNAVVDASDISTEALKIATQNAKILGASVHFFHSDLFASVNTKYHLIVSNPPYVTTEEMKHLEQEVQHDPILALHGGEDGLDLVRAIISQAPNRLEHGGRLFLEVGHHHHQEVAKLMQKEFTNIKVFNDYNHISRFITGEKRSNSCF